MTNRTEYVIQYSQQAWNSWYDQEPKCGTLDEARCAMKREQDNAVINATEDVIYRIVKREIAESVIA